MEILAGSLVPEELPPIDEEHLEGPPSTTWSDFKHPKLRQFPRGESEIKWLGLLGFGLEGLTFKAIIAGQDDPVVVKIFWRTLKPEPETSFGVNPIWAFKYECRTVALLEKIKWAMACAQHDPGQAISIQYGPKTHTDGIKNLRAFSDESRHAAEAPPGRGGIHPPPPFPPLPKCYGWTKIKRDLIPSVYPPVIEVVDNVDWHWAIVYEFVPEQDQDLAVAQVHLDFFNAVGFAMQLYKSDNWRGGRLVDQNDVCSPLTSFWDDDLVEPRDAKEWFSSLAFPRHQFARFKMVHQPYKRFFFKYSSVPGLAIRIKPPHTAEDAGQQISAEKDLM